MAFKLIKTATVVRTVDLVQTDESGKQHAGKLRVRFNVLPRDKWEEITNASAEDDRLLFDVVVKGIEDEIDDGSGVLSPEAALAAVRGDLSLTGQIVDQFMEHAFGAAAKNARRSRAR